MLGVEDPASDLSAIREGIRRGGIKALIVLGEDVMTDADFTAEDLESLDFLMQTHRLANPTASAADLVLPGAAFAEKRGSMVNLTGRLQRLNRAVEPPASAKDDWEILRDLIHALGGNPGDLNLIEDAFRAMASVVPAFDGLTLSKIGHQGLQVIETGYQIPLLANERAAKAAGKFNG